MKKRIVIKIGTHIITDENFKIDIDRIKKITYELAKLHNSGNEIIIITSGAICVGAGKLSMKERPRTIREKQACASVGQPLLMNIYEKEFSSYKINIAQLLLTRQDFEDREKYLNINNTIFTLLKSKVIPIINENDCVSVEEIRIGDNDTLSALVASKVQADILILLTDVDGLYDRNPRNSDAKLIKEIVSIDDSIEKIAKKNEKSLLGTGGMYTKIQAAKISSASGVLTYIINGLIPENISKLINGENIGTKIYPKEKSVIDSRKKWIAFGRKVKGEIIIDDGAVDAIVNKNKSLLPSGIIEVIGNFKQGDTVSVCDKTGKEIARGLTYFSSDETNKIKGKKSSCIYSLIGRDNYEEVIHRDNLVVIS